LARMPDQHAIGFAPLTDFRWEGREFTVGSLCRVIPAPQLEWEGEEVSAADMRRLARSSILRMSPFTYALSENDRSKIEGASHWVVAERLPSDPLKTGEKVNLFQLCLWFAVPTRTRVELRFEFASDHFGIVRCLDQFEWNKEDVCDAVETEHLEQASRFADGIVRLRRDGRVWSALMHTLAGCTSHHWQDAFVPFCAATEAILVYSRKRGIMERLAKSLACLTERDGSSRDGVYRQFCRLYGVRSDIMHARKRARANAGQNLADLAEISGMLRALWRAVLPSPKAVDALEKSDRDREKFFTEVEKGYQAPR